MSVVAGEKESVGRLAKKTTRNDFDPPLFSSSTHTEDGALHVSLTKADRGEPWPAAFALHAPAAPDAPNPDAARLLLERFAEEHPGFDFSGATVSGDAPDPRTFLGGIGRPQ